MYGLFFEQPFYPSFHNSESVKSGLNKSQNRTNYGIDIIFCRCRVQRNVVPRLRERRLPVALPKPRQACLHRLCPCGDHGPDKFHCEPYSPLRVQKSTNKMFRPHKGTCIECQHENVIIAVKKGYCQRCNERIKKEKKGKPLTPEPKKRKVTGELALFKAIWETRPHNCEVCGCAVTEFDPKVFSHVLSKGAYPSFRLYDRNIMIMCYEYDGSGCHQQWEFGDKGTSKFSEARGRAQELKSFYYNQ
jgi:hypothetical protein